MYLKTMLPFVHIYVVLPQLQCEYSSTPFEDVPVDSLPDKEKLIEANTIAAQVRCRSHEEGTGNYCNYCTIASRLSKSAGSREDIYPTSCTISV